MDWDAAFLEQSRADRRVLSVLEKANVEDCHYLHYLQMTTEKLAKAIDARSQGGREQPKRSHKALVRQLRLLARNPALQDLLGVPGKSVKGIIDGVLPLAGEVESLSPDLAQGGPNPEYPWQAPHATVVYPAKYAFTLIGELKSRKGKTLIWILDMMRDNFRRLFGGDSG